MGRSPCCAKVGMKKGPWTPEEDQKLLAYIDEHGHGSWRALPEKAGLQRCGKSCRLRWTNYLRPDIKRGKFSLQEEQTIIQLHALLGNRWSAIATHLPKRTDNEIKNYWNTHLKKRLAKMGIDPVTHKPKSDAIFSGEGQSKNAANLSHMAQWESARLEAEARLVRQSKLRSNSLQNPNGLPDLAELRMVHGKSVAAEAAPPTSPLCHDILKTWNGAWTKQSGLENFGNSGSTAVGGGSDDLESLTSTLSYPRNASITAAGIGETSPAFIEFVGSSGSCDPVMNEEDEENNWKSFGSSTNFPEFRDGIDKSISYTSGFHDLTISMESAWAAPASGNENLNDGTFAERFTDLLLNNPGDGSLSDGDESDDGGASVPGDCFEDNKNYWNSILNLVNSSPPDSPIF